MVGDGGTVLATPILAPNWKRILKHAWSIRMLALVVVVNGADTAWQYFDGYFPLSKVWFGIVAFGLSMGAIYARIVYQPKLHEGTHDE